MKMSPAAAIQPFRSSMVPVIALVTSLSFTNCASDSTVAAGSVQTNTFRNASIQFDYPSGWNVTEATDPQDPATSLVFIGSRDEEEFALVYFRPGGLPSRDYLRDAADTYVRNWTARGTWVLLTTKFGESLKYGGVDSGLVRLSDDSPPEFIGTAISAPGTGGNPDNAAFIVYKRNSTAPRERCMGCSNPQGIIERRELTAYAGRIPLRQLILTTFTFLHAGERAAAAAKSDSSMSNGNIPESAKIMQKRNDEDTATKYMLRNLLKP